MNLRNWIEKALGKRLAFFPTGIGMVYGRKLYSITFEDGTEGDYFIDYDHETVEAY